MSKSTTFLSLCLSFILGIGLRSWLDIPLLTSYAIFLLGLVIVILFWQNLKKGMEPKKGMECHSQPFGSAQDRLCKGWLNLFRQNFKILGLMAIFLFLGILRFELNIPRVDQRRIQFYNGNTITFVGIVTKEPDVRVDHTKLTVSKLSLRGATLRSERSEVLRRTPPRNGSQLKGKVLIKARLYPQYQYGDQLKITCDLKTPEPVNDFDYPSYLRGKNIYSLCYYPKIKLLNHNKGNFIYQQILNFKDKLKSTINSSLPEPEASLFSALGLGNRGGLTNKLKENFQKTGTSHIIAISGLHISLIFSILTGLILSFISSRKKAFVLSFLILFLFIILIGFSASAIRAGVMGFLAGIAPFVGRRKTPINALIFIAALMLLISPQILMFDLGFQLSFLAVLGIIYIGPILQERFSFFKKIKNKDALVSFRMIIMMTIVAQIMTLPWIIYKFEIFPLIGLLANILILPIIPLLIFLGLLATLVGSVLGQVGLIGQVLFWPTWLLLAYVFKVIEILSLFPWASLQIRDLPFSVVLVMYVGIWFGIWKLSRNKLLITVNYEIT